ncbi:hypothetical protein Rs2_48981 [Raphanus sativus]|nr:hypothetical protein Rs2_48981 [Raphanus sativus]
MLCFGELAKELIFLPLTEVDAMEDQCIMCGEWVLGNGGKWDFVLDKSQMARLVPLYEGISLRELQCNVLREFGVEEDLFGAALKLLASDEFRACYRDLRGRVQRTPTI